MKTVCDWGCAEANDCIVGGIKCVRCGEYFYSRNIGDEGLCPDCATEKEKEGEMK